MKRALMYASVASMIQQFNMHNIVLLRSLGYEVDVVCNLDQGSSISDEKIAAMKSELEAMGVQVFHVPVPRKVTAIVGILDAFCVSRRLMNERQYDLIHCHSPIGGMICRLANRCSRGYRKTKMIYTAHGFHFYKGAPAKNWLMYYPVERVCAWFTDVLITINQEDCKLAQEKMGAGEVIYIPGIGIDTKTIAAIPVDRAAKRKEISVPAEATLLLSVGELNENKNHEVIIRALTKQDDSVHYAVAGKGHLDGYLMELAEQLGVAERVHLLGYRTDVMQLYKASDLFVFPSFREGLPVSLMEAMATGKAAVCSHIRGTVDLIQENVGGFLVDPSDVDGFADCIQRLLSDVQLRAEMEAANREFIQNFDREKVESTMRDIYAEA